MKMHFETSHNEIICVLSIKESTFLLLLIRSGPGGFTKRTPRLLLIICIGHSRYEKHFPLCDVELWTFWMGAFSLDGWMQDWLKGTNARISSFPSAPWSTEHCTGSLRGADSLHVDTPQVQVENNRLNWWWLGERKVRILSCCFYFNDYYFW